MQQRVRLREEPSSLLELTRWGWESMEIKVTRIHRADQRGRELHEEIFLEICRHPLQVLAEC